MNSFVACEFGIRENGGGKDIKEEKLGLLSNSAGISLINLLSNNSVPG